MGKSTLVQKVWASFDYYVGLSLEKEAHLVFFTIYGDDVRTIIEAILLENNVPNDLGNVLLFIDEIQESPMAIKLLMYFYEELPQLHVIAAGSLLEFAMDQVQSFHVGRVLQLALHPTDFEEFLEATGEDQALKNLNTIPLPDVAFQKLIDLYHVYARVGGMPEAVKKYINNGKSLIGMEDVYSSIWDNYLDDIEKYANNNSEKRMIRHVLATAPNVRDRITFSNFGGANYKSRDIGNALRMLDLARVIRLLYPTSEVQPPISDHLNRKPKIHFLDTGLLNYAAGIQSELLAVKDLNSVYRGYIINHLVNQELIAKSNSIRYKPHIWVRENANANAEVDVVVRYHQSIIPVEIKSGAKGRLRSMHEFIDRTNHLLGVRLWANKVHLEKSKTRTDKEFALLNLPYFLACKLDQYVDWAKGKSDLDLKL